MSNTKPDSSQVKFIPAGAGAVPRTVQAKLRESVSVLDFGAVGDGTTDDSAAFQAAVTSGATTVIVPLPSVNWLINTPVMVPVGVTLQGQNFNTGMIGPYVQVAPSIKKTSNTTALVPTWNGSIFTTPVARDCVFYCEAAFFDVGSGGASDGYYPQNFGFKSLSISGPGPSGSNAAIYAEFGSGMIIENVDAVNFTHGLWNRGFFSSTFTKLRTNGRITCDSGGTSLVLNQCSAQEGFWMNNFLYSTFNSCASDGGSSSAYNIVGCSGLVFNGCGGEDKTSTGATAGTVWDFGGGNYGIVINGGVAVGRTGSVYPIVSVKDGDNIIFTCWRDDPGPAVGVFDLYVNSTQPATYIKFIDCYFRNFTKAFPDIQWLGAGSKVVVDYVDNRKIITSAGTKTITPPTDGAWTPHLTFDNNSVGMAQVCTGNYIIDGDTFIASGIVTLTAKGSSTGPVILEGLPFIVGTSGASVTINSQGNMTGAIYAGGYINPVDPNIFIYKNSTPSALLDDTDFTNTSTFRFTVVGQL